MTDSLSSLQTDLQSLRHDVHASPIGPRSSIALPATPGVAIDTTMT